MKNIYFLQSKRLVAAIVVIALVFNSVPAGAYAQAADNTPALAGLRIDPNDPFKFAFLFNETGRKIPGHTLKVLAGETIHYFLAALTIPEEELWVNLSPDEANRIITPTLGATELGASLLNDDYNLKQLSAGLTDPRSLAGKKYWQDADQAPAALKVWVTADQAAVSVEGYDVLIDEARLRVQTQTDYLNKQDYPPADKAALAFKHHILPLLQQRIDYGQDFSRLRNAYRAMILAAWYKKTLKESIIARIYADKKKTGGIDHIDAQNTQTIYARYLETLRKGAYNYIRCERVSANKLIRRRYFSGGVDMTTLSRGLTVTPGLSKPRSHLTVVAGRIINGIKYVARPPKQQPLGQNQQTITAQLFAAYQTLPNIKSNPRTAARAIAKDIRLGDTSGTFLAENVQIIRPILTIGMSNLPISYLLSISDHPEPSAITALNTVCNAFIAGAVLAFIAGALLHKIVPANGQYSNPWLPKMRGSITLDSDYYAKDNTENHFAATSAHELAHYLNLPNNDMLANGYALLACSIAGTKSKEDYFAQAIVDIAIESIPDPAAREAVLRIYLRDETHIDKTIKAIVLEDTFITIHTKQPMPSIINPLRRKALSEEFLAIYRALKPRDYRIPRLQEKGNHWVYRYGHAMGYLALAMYPQPRTALRYLYALGKTRDVRKIAHLVFESKDDLGGIDLNSQHLILNENGDKINFLQNGQPFNSKDFQGFDFKIDSINHAQE